MPKRRLGQSALSFARPPAKTGQVDAQDGEPHVDEGLPQRALQRGPAVQHFAGADVVTVAMGMNIEDGRSL